ncbi:MAG: head-tail adaptor protein [Hyphomicrobiaceae bacterium]|nr:MAG: head-tail adaptor protein [Hyphomicrobiaceae bacterium]
MTRSGALSALIEIQQSTEPTRGTTGQELKNWTRLCRLWAQVESTDTSERFQGDREIGYKLKYFTVRHKSTIRPDCRILYKNEYYNIRSVKEMEKMGRDRFMRILGEIVEETSQDEQ